MAWIKSDVLPNKNFIQCFRTLCPATDGTAALMWVYMAPSICCGDERRTDGDMSLRWSKRQNLLGLRAQQAIKIAGCLSQTLL